MQLINWRLQQLEARENASNKLSSTTNPCLGFTLHQFTDWIAQCKAKLQQAWISDQRSLALSIAIQCIRRLSVSSPLLFYPAKFALCVDVLNTLAALVLERLKTSNASDDGETSRNWWRKVCRIRELLPRLYLQVSVLILVKKYCKV